MEVSKEMTRTVEVIGPDLTVREAAEKMRIAHIGFLPVCDGTRLVGTLTDRDIAVRVDAYGKDSGATKVREVMTPRVEWCFEDDSIGRAARRMEEKQIRRLPVINHEKKLVGVVSRGDLRRVSAAEQA